MLDLKVLTAAQWNELHTNCKQLKSEKDILNAINDLSCLIMALTNSLHDLNGSSFQWNILKDARGIMTELTENELKRIALTEKELTNAE